MIDIMWGGVLLRLNEPDINGNVFTEEALKRGIEDFNSCKVNNTRFSTNIGIITL